MKAVPVTESDGIGYQHMTGFERKREKKLGGSMDSHYWDAVLSDIMDKLGGVGSSVGCDIFIGLLGGGGGIVGVNEKSAQRSLALAKGAFNGITGGEAVSDLFSLSGLSFNKIDESAFVDAVNGLQSDDAKALAWGYFYLINGPNTLYTQVINLTENESIDLTNVSSDVVRALNLTDIFDGSNANKAAGRGGVTVPGIGGNNAYVLVAQDSKHKIKVKSLDGGVGEYELNGSFTFSHEAVGHGLSTFYGASLSANDRYNLNQLNGVQVSNMYFRAHSLGHFDPGYGHWRYVSIDARNPISNTVPVNIVNQMPFYLRFHFIMKNRAY